VVGTNALGHVAQAILFGGYVPGLFTAVLLGLPYACWGCRESPHLAPLETPSFTHSPLAEFVEFGTLRDDFTRGGRRWPSWERSRSWSQRTWCRKAPRSGRSPARWA